MSPESDIPPAPPVPPDAPAVPEAPIGKIVDPNAQSSGLLKQPSADDLAKFAPPPPIAPAVPAVPIGGDPNVATPADMTPVPLPGSSPDMPVYPSGDNMRGLGMALGADPSGRVDVIDPPPAEPRPKAFHELSERTQAELKTGWASKNKGKEFPADWIEPVRSSPAARHDPSAPPSEPDHDAIVEVDKKSVKVSQRTLDEMEAGRRRNAERKAETERVRRLQAQQNAEKLDDARSGGPVVADASNMDYTEGR